MRAMVLRAPGAPLEEQTLPDPEPARGQALLRVLACGVCRTDLHVVDGELTRPKLPLVPGHQIVAEVIESAGGLSPGARVGVPWLGWTCGTCRFCSGGRGEPLRRRPLHRLRPRRRLRRALRRGRALLLPDPRRLSRSPGSAAALRRPDRLSRAPHGRRRRRGSASSASARRRTSSARSRCTRGARSPRSRGRRTTMRGRSPDRSARPGPGARPTACPEELDAAIVFAPAGELVPAVARARSRKGGVVVCAGIHMSDIPAFPYELLWGERVVRSVANLTRRRRRGVPRARAPCAGAHPRRGAPARRGDDSPRATASRRRARSARAGAVVAR